MGMGGLTGNEFAYTGDAFNSSINQNDAKGISKEDIRKRMVQQQVLPLVLYVMFVGFFISKKEIKMNRLKCKNFEFSCQPSLGLINAASQGNWVLT